MSAGSGVGTRQKRSAPQRFSSLTEVSLTRSAIRSRCRSLRGPNTANLVIHLAGDAAAAGLCKAFETGSHVDAVAIDTGIVKDDVTLIDADAEAQAAMNSVRHERPFFRR